MKETLTQKFIKEIANIKSPEVFLGVARILKVQLMEDKETAYDFVKIFSNTVEAFDKADRARKKELLKKQFSTTRHMIIRLNLNNMKSKIIKIGKEFIQFSCLAKKIFYNEIKHKKETISTDKQIFRFVIWDNHGNLKNFVYTYKIFPNLQKGIAYIDGHYQI